MIVFDSFLAGMFAMLLYLLALMVMVEVFERIGKRWSKKARSRRALLRARDVKGLAAFDTPWLYEGNLGESPYMDERRSISEDVAREDIDDYWSVWFRREHRVTRADMA